MSVYVLDTQGILYQNFHALPPMSGPSGEPVGAIYGLARDLFTLLSKYKPSSLICAFDMHGPTFRHRLYEQYKANRKETPEDLKPQVEFAKEMLGAFGAIPIGIVGYEADDVMATIARQVEERGETAVLVTADKDCRQLITERVSLFNLRKQRQYSFADLKADWGITPSQVIDFQTMVGDPTDNIPGIPLIGPKLATQLLEQYGTLEGVLENVDSISGAKRKANIRQARETVELGKKLVTLDTRVPIEIDWEQSRFRGVDAAALVAVFRRFGFKSLADRVGELTNRGETGGENRGDWNTTDTIVRKEERHSLFDAIDEKRDFAESREKSWEKSQAISAIPCPTFTPPVCHLVDTAEKFDGFLKQLEKVSCFSFDTETAPMEPAFEATMPRYTVPVGLSFCWDESEAFSLPLRGPLGAETLDRESVLKSLKPILENPVVGKIGQNLKYDIVVLRGCGINLRGLIFDTMIADYLLHAGYRTHNMDDLAAYYLDYKTTPIKDLIGTGKKRKRMDEVPTDVVAAYAGEDAWIVWKLYPILKDLLDREGKQAVELNDDLEIPLVDVLADMEYAGIALDRDKLKNLSVRFEEMLRSLEKEIYALAGHEFNIASPKQLQAVLFEELKLPVVKKTAKTGPSTDVEVLTELAAVHPLPDKVREHRRISKLQGTYVDALPQLIHPQTGRVHASFNQVVTATGRLSSSNPNLQNIPVKTELGREIREAFIPDRRAGFDRILSCDYSQIELRVLAHCCGDDNLCTAFENDEDIHASVAAQVFGIPIGEITPSMRRTAKAVNFGVIYGQTAFGLARALKISKEEAAAFINAYFEKYTGITAFIDETLQFCFKHGYVETLGGRRLAIEGVRAHRKGDLANAERMAINTVVQGSAADLMKQAMVRIHRDLSKRQAHGLRANMLLQIHDELVFETTTADLEPLRESVVAGMTLDSPLRVPLKIDCEAGSSWA